MEVLVQAGTLTESCALQLSEALLAQRNAEIDYARLRNPEGVDHPGLWAKAAARRVRDAGLETQVMLVAYEFVRSAPLWFSPGHRIALPNMRQAKLDAGLTLEMLAGRLGLPEATLLCIEDGMEVSIDQAARIARAMRVRLRELVLEQGQSIESYWHDLGKGTSIV